ncbi:MAG: hypothetical protein ACKV19_02360 [Verrucomicrobiales bacterium]
MKTLAQLTLQVALAATTLILGSVPLRAAADHGDTPQSAARIVSGVTSGRIDGYGDVDWFWFRPSMSGPATVSTLPNPTGSVPGQFFVEWLNASQRPVANPHANPMKVVVSAGQTYFLRVRKSNNMPLYPNQYSLKLLLPQGATLIQPAETLVNADLKTPQDVNLFSFAITAPGRINLMPRPQAALRPTINVFVELFDGAGNRLDAQWNNDIRRVLPSAGRYFVRVTPSPSAPNTGAYALQILTNSRATPVTNTYAGRFDVLQDRDYIRFRVSRSGMINITSSGVRNIRAFLFDAAGNRVVLPNSTGALPINKLLTMGDYYLLLEPNPSGGRTGNYQIVIRR